MEGTFLSVIVVTYNAEGFLSDCLLSIWRAGRRLQGRGLHFETVVVDNASRDKTVAVAKGFPWVRIIPVPKNLGFAAGVNQGAKATGGEWILLLNPDCVVDEEAFCAFHDFVKDHPLVGAVGFQLLNPDGSLQPSGRRFPKSWEFALSLLGFQEWVQVRLFSQRNFSRTEEVEEISGAALAVRRIAFESVGGMDEEFFLYFEDLDLCRRLRASGWRIIYLPSAKVWHLWGASVKQVPSLSRWAQQQSALRYFRKHHGGQAATLVWAALTVQQLGRFLRDPHRWHRHCLSLRRLFIAHPFKAEIGGKSSTPDRLRGKEERWMFNHS